MVNELHLHNAFQAPARHPKALYNGSAPFTHPHTHAHTPMRAADMQGNA